MGTFVPKMSTISKSSSLASVLFGKARLAVLALIYGHPDKSFYVRQVVRAAGIGHGAAQRELTRLAQAGILHRAWQGRQVYYQANPQCAIFEELKSLVVKTAGVADVLRAALLPLAERIQAAFIFGSMAEGRQNQESDVDLLIIGKVNLREVVTALSQAQTTLGREVNPTVYPPEEFRQKLAQGHHFLKSLVENPRIFLIGDEHELARLGEKRLAR